MTPLSTPNAPFLVVDADLFLFKFASAAEKTIRWDDDIHTIHGDLSVAQQHFEETLETLYSRFPQVDRELTLFALSCSVIPRWRPQVYAEYKSNRKNGRKPLVYKALENWLCKTYFAYTYLGCEGDDVLGVWATNPNYRSRVIMVSSDKDLKSIPGTLHNYDKNTTVATSVEDADRWHLLQTLTGDATDGYPGCPGIGPKKAEALFAKHGWSWETVTDAYHKAGLSEDYALTQARVARILRYEEWDFLHRCPRLWEPPAHL